MCMRTRFVAAVSVITLCSTLLVACGGGGGGAPGGGAGSNTGLAIAGNFGVGMASVGPILFVLVNEIEQNGTDLNGDGDIADDVVHMIDTTTGTITNLGVSGTHVFGSDGVTVAWILAEEDEGATDVNMDGDTSDHVITIFDPALPVGPGNPAISVAVVDSFTSLQGSNGTYAYLITELSAFTDLTGDGDIDDLVVNTVDSGTLAVYNTGLPVNSTDPAFLLANGVLAFNVAEDEFDVMMANDFNGDGDSSDTVLFGHVPGSGVNFACGPFGFARAIEPNGFTIAGTSAAPVIAYAIDEAGEQLDLNLFGLVVDGDTEDFVCGIFDVNGAFETIPGGGLAIQPGRLRGSSTRLVISAPEADNGAVPADFNSDNDSDDVVPFWIDLAAPGTLNNIGIAQDMDAASLLPRVCGEFVVMFADEPSQGPNGTNYNQQIGDSDTDDTVPFFVDISTPATIATNLGIAANQMICSDTTSSWVIAVCGESENGGNDLNFDQDTTDEVLHYFPVNGGVIDTTLRPMTGGGSSNSIVMECPTTVHVISFVEEGSEQFFQDRNRDGDTDDFIVIARQIQKATGAIGGEMFVGTVEENTGMDDFPFPVGTTAVAFPSNEASIVQGVNYNGASGDADTFDNVLFFLNLNCL